MSDINEGPSFGVFPSTPDERKLLELEASNKVLQEKLEAYQIEYSILAQHGFGTAMDAVHQANYSIARAAKLVEQGATIESLNLRLARLVEELRKHKLAQINKDWACAECHPESDMLVAGFKCSYHSALSTTDQDNQQWLREQIVVEFDSFFRTLRAIPSIGLSERQFGELKLASELRQPMKSPETDLDRALRIRKKEKK
jgi:hypothetical protein